MPHEYRVTWTRASNVDSVAKVLFVDADSEGDAHALACDHIERTLAEVGYKIDEVTRTLPLPDGCISKRWRSDHEMFSPAVSSSECLDWICLADITPRALRALPLVLVAIRADRADEWTYEVRLGPEAANLSNSYPDDYFVAQLTPTTPPSGVVSHSIDDAPDPVAPRG